MKSICGIFLPGFFDLGCDTKNSNGGLDEATKHRVRGVLTPTYFALNVSAEVGHPWELVKDAYDSPRVWDNSPTPENALWLLSTMIFERDVSVSMR